MVRKRTDTPRGETELPLRRLEAFSDGVFAIAITILVLELALAPDSGDDLLRAVLDQWPSYLAYVASFFTIGVVWMQHSALTGMLRAADVTLYRINLVVLLLASFLPFPTRIAAEYLHQDDAERVAVVFYGLTLVALVLSLVGLARYATGDRNLVRDDVDTAGIRDVRGANLGLYIVGILVGLRNPTAGVLIFLVSALARGLPVGAFRRLLARR